MYTQTHVLVGAALFSRRRITGRSLAAVAGSLAPDLALYASLIAARFAGKSNSEFFGELYWREPVVTIMRASHSLPIFGTLLLVGVVAWRQKNTGENGGGSGIQAGAASFGEALTFFCLAALLHAVTDFMLHNEDAHMQLWPISRWKFASPVSYWDPSRFGSYWSLLEAALGIFCAIVLWRRFSRIWIRILCVGAIVMYVAAPFYFTASMPDHVM